MIKKISTVLILLAVMSKGFAQDLSGKLPQLLPVTPTAAGLINVGMGEVNKSTGAVTAALPLYEIKAGNYKLPISLSYFSRGNKREELCARVGFGWSLVAGGVVTRTVRGMPDGEATRLPIPANMRAQTQDNIDYFEAGKTRGSINESFDTQPDEYNFSFSGYNGKFVINDAGEAVVISHENLKITLTGGINTEVSAIKIITPDGVQYFFGGAYDKTTRSSEGGAALQPKTAFYLHRITTPSGSVIDLTYGYADTKSNVGFSESKTLPGTQLYTHYDAGHQHFSSQYLLNHAAYLTGITASDGTEVIFSYEGKNDLSGDVRLTTLSVRNQNNTEVTRYKFDYEDGGGFIDTYPTGALTSVAGRNKRFYLKTVHRQYRKDIDSYENLDYKFDYYGNIDLEPGGIFGQDHFGFLNGRNNQSLIPETYVPDDFPVAAIWGDRTPDWHAAEQGMLHTITYPTTGKEEFFYEANTISVQEEVTDIHTSSLLLHGTGTGNTSYYYITPHKAQTVNFIFNIAGNSPSCNNHDGDHGIIFTILDQTTGLQVGTVTVNIGTGEVIMPATLQADHTYRLALYIYPVVDACYNIYFDYSYDAALPGPQPVEKEAGGVRVKKITKTDAFGAVLNKFFFYGTHATPNVSSGIGHLTGAYENIMRAWSCDPSPINECDERFDRVLSSNSIFNLYNLGNSHIYYKNIIEADDELFLNGATEYTFYDPIPDNTGEIIWGSLIPNPPGDLNPNFAGMLYKTKQYDGAGNLKASAENNYEMVATVSPVRTIYIRKVFEATNTNGVSIYYPLTIPLQLSQFDVRESVYSPGWIKLHDTKNIQYDNLGNPFETNTTYSYGGITNILPTLISTTDSKGNTLNTLKKYPNEFPSDPVLTAMTAANMITPVIEERTRLNLGTELSKTVVTYADNGIPGAGFQPSVIQQKQRETGVTENRILFSAYDDKGNLKEVSKAQDGKISYLWGYNKSLVTAEVKNAPKENIAYTSFEDDSKGNFSYTGGAPPDVTAPTGKKVYNLAEGAISFPAAAETGKPYIVSYWSNNGAKTVTGSASVITGRVADGWTYYEHKITSMPSGTKTISGTGQIDEVRLYPADAMMTTYTYDPLIGVTSQCDINNRITYYEYDRLNRLALVRDLNKNIVKKICYNYAGKEESCSGITSPSFGNVVKSHTFTRSNCEPPYMGGTYTYTVPANTYTATTQAAADQMAQDDVDAHGQSIANTLGNCITYSNTVQSQAFTRNDCEPGYTGSSVTYTVAAGTYSNGTQAAADQLALDDIAANGQAYANAHGTCTSICATCTGIDKKCINNVCETGTYLNIMSYLLHDHSAYRCISVYCFSDGTSSSEIINDGPLPCLVTGSCP